jgi:hypothetical protein
MNLGFISYVPVKQSTRNIKANINITVYLYSPPVNPGRPWSYWRQLRRGEGGEGGFWRLFRNIRRRVAAYGEIAH